MDAGLVTNGNMVSYYTSSLCILSTDKTIHYKYFLLDKWKPINTISNQPCPESVVPGDSGTRFEWFGKYGRTSSNSRNKLVRRVNSYRSWSVCKKTKKGIVQNKI